MMAMAMELTAGSVDVAAMTAGQCDLTREDRRVGARRLVALPGEGSGAVAENVAEVSELRLVPRPSGTQGWHVTDRGWAVILAFLGLLMVAGVVCVGATFWQVTA